MNVYRIIVRNLSLLIISIAVMTSCGVSKKSSAYNRQYSLREVSSDYHVFESILKQSHPGLYWYISKDSMEHYFRVGEGRLKDSMTEAQFRRIISYVVSKINCGHTSVKPSRQYIRKLDSSRFKRFPLNLKLWSDTAVVTANLNKNDNLLKRGTIITAVDGLSIKEILDSVFQFLPADGYSRTHKLQVLSTGSAFGSGYTSIFGQRDTFLINYIDTAGVIRPIIIPAHSLYSNSIRQRQIRVKSAVSRIDKKKQMLISIRKLRYDLKAKIAFMAINSFSRGYRLKRFFRRSFNEIKKNDIKYLVIDVRGNTGGNVTNSTLLTKFIINKPFKLADSLYALQRRSSYGKRIQHYFFNYLFMHFVTRKQADGYYHFKYFERHYFKPKNKNHFDGQTYVLTGGSSFSATSLFAQLVRQQENITILGEETGGGAYGNSAWLIPDVILPKTKVRFRLPLFRLVINKNIPKDGKGVQPEVEVKPTVEAIRKAIDFKMNKAMELIKQDQEKKSL